MERLRRSGEIDNATFAQMNSPGKREKFLKERNAREHTKTQLQDARIDQERVALAIDWLPIDSNPAAKQDAADEALVARQRELFLYWILSRSRVLFPNSGLS